MTTQLVAVEVSDAVLEKVRRLAPKLEMSVETLLGKMLANGAEVSEHYWEAAARQREVMREGLPFNTGGRVTWTRDELHERRPLE